MVAASAPEATRKMLVMLWERNLPIVKGRVEELQRAAEAANIDALSPEDRTSAEATAHKLAGSLGMFGYRHGTEIARELEQMLQGTASMDARRLAQLAAELRSELSI